MQQFLIILQIITQLFPVVIQAIKSVELAMPAGSNGAAKLAIVQAMLEKSYTVEQSAVIEFPKIWHTLESVISVAVAELNALGIFKKPIDSAATLAAAVGS